MRGLLPANAALIALLLGGCAHGNAQGQQRLEQVEAELRALRQEQRQDREQLRKLELHLAALAQRREAGASAGPARMADSSHLPPEDLAVVRLEPKAPPAEEEGGFIFIADRGEGAPTPEPAARRGGVDKAPALPTAVTLQERAPGADDRYEEGLAALQGRDYAKAIEYLERFVESSPRDGRADNALLALAEAHLAQERPGRTLRVLERLITDYPAGDAVPAALLKYGEVCMQTGRTAAARAAFQRLVDNHPGTPPSSAARQHLAGL